MDIGIVIAYLGVLLFYGIYQGYRVKSIREYSVSSSRHGLFVVFASLSAAFIGGGFSTGNASQVFKFGIGNIVALCGFSLGQVLVGSLIISRAKIQDTAASPGMIMRAAYGRGGQMATGLCSTVLCAGMLGAQIAAIGWIFNVLIGVPYAAGAVIGFAVVLVYSTLGGMNAIITAEVIEFILLAVGIPLLLYWSVKYAGGSGAVAQSVPEEYFNIFNGSSQSGFLSLFLTAMVGEAMTPSFIQRILTGRDRRTVARATVLSGIVSVPVFVMTGLVGLCAYAVDPQMPAEMAMPEMIVRAMPVGVKGLVMTAMLAIVMSTADGLLSSGSIGFINDLMIPMMRKTLPRDKLLRSARMSNMVIGVAGILMALWSADVFRILLLSYSAWCPVILVPITAALLGKKPGGKVFAVCGAGGAAASLIWTMLGEPWSIGGTVVGVAVNAFIFAAMTAFRRKIKNCRR